MERFHDPTRLVVLLASQWMTVHHRARIELRMVVVGEGNGRQRFTVDLVLVHESSGAQRNPLRRYVQAIGGGVGAGPRQLLADRCLTETTELALRECAEH